MENTITFNTLATKFLAWCESHQSPRTHEWYGGYLNKFMAYPGIAETTASGLKPYQVVEWIDSHGKKWGDTYRGGAVIAVKRVYNWAEELGYVDVNPVKKLKKPQPKRREIYMTSEDYNNIIALIDAKDPFLDLFKFVWQTGARPQEARHIETRHFQPQNERIVFPAEESKGKRTKRIIYLQGEALEIITRLTEERPEGKLFRNTRGEAWTKFAVCNRFHRFSQTLGKRLFCYAARHGFATRKLIQGHDHLTVASIMGHTDGSMLAKVYSHVSDNAEHLKKALVD